MSGRLLDQFATPFVAARLEETPFYETTVYDMDGIPEKHHVFDYFVVITLDNGDEWEHKHGFRAHRGRDGQDQSGAEKFLARVEGHGVAYLNHWQPAKDHWSFYRGETR